YVPGVSVPTDPVRFGADAISIRGVGGNRVLILTDGVPAPSGFAIGNFSDFGRPFADLDLIQRTEIMRGPASALYGSDAIGGVLSTRTLAPAEILGGEEAGARVRTTFNSADHGWLASGVGALQGPGGLDGFVAYARREGNELDNGSAALEPNPRTHRRDSVLAKIVLDGMASPLGLSVAQQRDGAVTLVNSDVLQPGRFANTTFMRGDDHGETSRILLEQTLGVDWLEQGVWRVFWQEGAADQATHETRRAAPPQTPPLDLERAFEYLEQTWGAQATFARALPGTVVNQRLVMGADVARHQITERRDGQQQNLATGATTNVILGEVLPLRDFPPSTEVSAGAYLQDELRPTGGRSAWIPALRIDYYHLAPTVDAIYAAGNPSQQPVSMSHASLSPRFGAT
ncbi:MAG: TonB-dependent receptor plug domain-containing protein, partial [Proteobacteria bacterium]|nr:TonB-dependent receptor plug domain-containing protein [Pseudomonadota bacterium]